MSAGFERLSASLAGPLDGDAAAAAQQRRGLARAAVVPLLMVAAALALRALSFVPTVIDTDEGLYILQAREWLRGGGWPLVAVWDMHPVGAPAFFALAFAIFGESIGTVRLLGALCIGMAGWGLYGAARAGGASRTVGLGAGLIYIAHTVLFGGLASNTEILFAPLVVAAVALGVRGATRALAAGGAPRWRDLALMGLLAGTALTIKPVAAPSGSLAFLLLTVPAWWRGVLPLGHALAMAAAYAALCATPTALFALAYAAHGHFAEFLDGAFLAPLRYAGGRRSFGDAAWEVVMAVLTLAPAFALGALAFARRRTAPAEERRLIAIGLVWFAASTVAVVGPGMFHHHYFLIWLPALSLLAALGARRLAELVGTRRAGLVFALVVGMVAVDAWQADAVPRLREGIGLRFADPPLEVARALAATVPPGASVLVANYHPVVYALARVRPATRYAFPALLTGSYGAVAGIDMDAEVARVLAARPAAIVVDRGWWHAMRPQVAAMVTAALREDYALATTVEEERGPVEIWWRR
jgi:4-amino-4-deoxy-L-arabinose transferase-like glycosyltransferase